MLRAASVGTHLRAASVSVHLGLPLCQCTLGAASVSVHLGLPLHQYILRAATAGMICPNVTIMVDWAFSRSYVPVGMTLNHCYSVEIACCCF